MTYSDLQPLLERDFNYLETLQVLKHNLLKYWSWGVSNTQLVDVDKTDNDYVKGLLLKVNAHRCKGYVLITLVWDDTYTVNIINNRGVISDTYKDVYFDLLVDTIDTRIEKIDDYVR